MIAIYDPFCSPGVVNVVEQANIPKFSALDDLVTSRIILCYVCYVMFFSNYSLLCMLCYVMYSLFKADS